MNNIPLEYMNYVKKKNDLEINKYIYKSQKGGINQYDAAQLEYDQMQYDTPNNFIGYEGDLNYMEASNNQLYEIPTGVILYHGSMNNASFNPTNIALGDDNLIAYFSPNKKLSADYIVGCSDYPHKQGFLHKFMVTRPIDKILIISSNEKKVDWSLSHIENRFCATDSELDGIGFFFPKRDSTNFISNNMMEDDGVHFDAEFALCDPGQNLDYISTQRCSSLRKMSEEYVF